MAILELWLGMGHRRGRDPVHWMFIFRAPDSSRCTWYHLTGGPSQNKAYTLQIQDGKRFDSHEIAEHHFIGGIAEKYQRKFKASVQKISMRQCQELSVKVLLDAEKKGLVPPGTGEYWAYHIEQ